METDLEASLSSDDDGVKILESELYSVFYHNDFSSGIPESLKGKYDIYLDEGRAVVSLKDSSVQTKDIWKSQRDLEGTSNGNVHSVHMNTSRYQKYVKNSITDKSDTTEYSEKTNFINGQKRKKKSKKNKRKKQDKKSKNAKESDSSDDDSVIIIEDEDVNRISKSELSDDIISVDGSSSSSDSFTIVHDSHAGSVEHPGRAGQKWARNKEKLGRKWMETPVVVSDSSELEFEPVINVTLNTSWLPGSLDVESAVPSESYNWKETSSPTSWTPSMKRYYNKPKQLAQCLYQTTISSPRDDWFVMAEDLYLRPRRKEMRCHRCRQVGHPSRRCTKQTTCKMCGTPGHSDSRCPGRMCLNCGEKRSDVFVAGCSKCSRDDRTECSICQDLGHQSSLCPDVWRRFHSTVKQGEPVAMCEQKSEASMYCCNCGSKGHLYEHCCKLRWSAYPVTSSFVKNYKGESAVRSKRTILLPDHIQPSSDELSNMVKKKGLKVKLNNYKGINSLVVKGNFSLVSQLRESILSLAPPVPKSRAKKKHKRKLIIQ